MAAVVVAAIFAVVSVRILYVEFIRVDCHLFSVAVLISCASFSLALPSTLSPPTT